LRPWEYLASHLDSTFPGWPEVAADLILRGTGDEIQPSSQIAAGLLALRPLTFHTPLCQSLVEPINLHHRELSALALLGTDRAEVRGAYRSAFDELAGRRFAADSTDCRALWLIFARLAQEKSLSYKDLRAVALESDLFQPEGRPQSSGRAGAQALPRKGGISLHPCLDRCGLSHQPEFRRLYSMLVAEILPSLAEARPWHWLRWIRCFPGADYLFEALDCLELRPNDLHALFVARWSQELREEEELLAERLADYAPLTLMLASLLRPHQDEIFGKALGSPLHSEAMKWLRLPCSKAADSDRAIQETVIPWAREYCGLFTDALGALCAVKVPFEEPLPECSGAVTEVAQLQRFFHLHLLPAFLNLTDNLLLLQGLLNQNLNRIEGSARVGRTAAIRALGMAEGTSEEGLRFLLNLHREGGEPVRRAAQWALEKVAARHGLGSTEALRRKLDMAAAWQDGGLADSPSRVWWDIAGYRVKLSLAQGKVEVSAWKPGRKKRIPAEVRAHPLFAEVQETRKALARTYAIFRERLEEMMLTGQPFPGEQFRFLFTNPAFRSLTERLVLSLDEKEILLESLEKREVEGLLAEAEQVRVIHPIELWAADRLETWQENIVNRHVFQPFKQCFREIYLQEAGERPQTRCLRFSKQPILPRKAYALLKRRGYSPCRGDAYRDWPSDGIRARFIWAEAREGLWKYVVGVKQSIPLTTGAIYFERLQEKLPRASAQGLPLEEVDPIVFSETLRDADLVVSAAAAGEEGFSSRQTVEIRAALVKNFARLLNLPGVKVDAGSSHAHIQGKRASYRIHLGSGRVLVEPSGQHLPLPSKTTCKSLVQAEEKTDSRTLTILETVAALSYDGEISDPEFLSALPLP
ncbi:MAG: DUF4132 domain-containing protein, partial [Armatimonadetes bacterium]|nr:DUF4132 domain-containing protein [Armatimonadota bacterium]NIM23532.1 DUF4132 domain-containing protein [Armatimonadota bacterium]NIM67398.1 DUF4132 domain-containing protein [Armatimonadota bacterium]NIM75899.1 DUF4132 domain-containing protein [Armatimonadota bacterium]NIN05584.1 DUF4132 domain-containing protein [Armatimonadota bacterium]